MASESAAEAGGKAAPADEPGEKVTFRTESEVAGFFTGLELVEPGMVNAPRWRPASQEEASSPAALWSGVARKP